MSPALSKALHIIGGVLGVLSVIFVGERLYHYSGEIDVSRISIAGWWLLGLLSVVYGVANILLAIAWWNLLKFFEINARVQWAIRVYGLSLLAKYVPGNVFQFVGRQALGMAEGYTGKPLAKSSVWELALLAAAGCLFGVLSLPLILSSLSVFAALVAFVFLGCAMVFLLWQYLSPLLSRALIWHTLFLLISGLVFIGTFEVIEPGVLELGTFSVLCGAYVVAWLAGLVTPGAPAGLGVREAVTLFLLSSIVSPASLLLAIVLSRVITILGDLLFFSLSAMFYVDKKIFY